MISSRWKKIMGFLLIALIFTSCKKENKSLAPTPADNLKIYKSPQKERVVMSGIVKELMNVSHYTYAKIQTADKKEIWVAIRQTPLKKGQLLKLSHTMLMKNFTSKTLNRTFKEIYFATRLNDNASASTRKNWGKFHRTTHNIVAKNTILKRPLPKAKGKNAYNISELYQKAEKLKGKSILLRGKVVKYHANIMNRSWIHLQDGTSYKNNFDITVTSPVNRILKTKVGNIITIRGILTTKKDFGAGYFYPLIIEKATLIK